MRPWRRRNVAAGAFVTFVALAGTGTASAQATRSVRIDYDAATGCPDAKSFEEQIHARSSKIIVAPDGSASVRVRITARGGRFEGDAVLSDLKGHEAHRRVEGGCADVTAALALITALALDPMASTATDPGAVAPPAPSAPAGVTPPLPTAKPETPRKPALAPLASGSEPLLEGETNAHTWGWSIGAHAGLTAGVAPVPLLSVPAFVEVWRRSTRPLAPALRLRFERADSGTVTVGSTGSGADFTWTAGSLDVCPVALAAWRIRLWPCVRAEGGALVATGRGVSPTRTDTRPWFTVGLVARARFTVIGSLFLELEGGAFAPIVRDRFFVEPDATIQRAPLAAVAAAAGVGVTFW